MPATVFLFGVAAGILAARAPAPATPTRPRKRARAFSALGGRARPRRRSLRRCLRGVVVGRSPPGVVLLARADAARGGDDSPADAERALALLSRAERATPNDFQVALRTSSAALRAGQAAEALAAAERALAVEPASANAWEALARARLAANDAPGAAAAADQALGILHDYPGALVTRAQAAGRLGDAAAADGARSRLSALAVTDTDARRLLATLRRAPARVICTLMALRVAIVHDWLVSMRGGERVLESLCRLYPRAPIFTLRYEPRAVSAEIAARDVRTAFIDPLARRLPLGAAGFRMLLPLFPRAIESLPLADFDLVISSSHAVAKGAIAAPGALHVSYVHSPMRYIWEAAGDYAPSVPGGPIGRAIFAALSRYLRRWDVASTARVQVLVANSGYTQARIRRAYGRDAEVIEPPVDAARFAHIPDPPPRARRPGLSLRLGAGPLQARRAGGARVRARRGGADA